MRRIQTKSHRYSQTHSSTRIKNAGNSNMKAQPTKAGRKATKNTNAAAAVVFAAIDNNTGFATAIN